MKSYIHIRDVSKGELLAMEKGTNGEIYHLSPDSGVAVRDVVATIAEELGLTFEEATDIVEERLGQDKAYTIDSSKARKDFGWKPEISLQEGVAQTIAWVNEHFAAITEQPLEYVHKE